MSHDPEHLRRVIGDLIRELERLPTLNRATQNLLDNLREAVAHYDAEKESE